MTRPLLIADLFCGAGGGTSGAVKATEALGHEIDLVCVNHWSVAIATHSKNHVRARHHCINLDAARPEDLVPEGRLDLLMASPECTFHSRARGGKPISDQLRADPWHVQRWATKLDVTRILIENVPEFRDWGPVDEATGRPIKEKKGLYFQGWIQSLWALGYDVDWRLVNAANHGDATTRVRFFLQARKDGVPIRWPEPTHTPDGGSELFRGPRKWRSAREVIDWTRPGPSLLNRKRPLSLKTRLRIARGLQKFGGRLAPLYIRLLDLPAEDAARFLVAVDGSPMPFIVTQRDSSKSDGTPTPSRPRSIGEPCPTITTIARIGLVEPVAEPFVVANRNNAVAKSADEPIPTATTATGGGMFLVEPTAEPFILGQQSGSVARSVDQPIPTIATGGAIRLAEPHITPYYQDAPPDSVDEPLATVTTKARFGLVEPVIISTDQTGSNGLCSRGIDSPLPTFVTKQTVALVEPIVTHYRGQSIGRSVDQPLPTLTAGGGHLGLVEPVLVEVNHSGDDSRRPLDVDAPLPTLSTRNGFGLAEPLVVPYGPRAEARAVSQPVPTILTKDRLGVATPTLEPWVLGRHSNVLARDVDKPLPTVTGSGAGYLVQPFIVPQYGEAPGQAPRIHDVDKPLPAVTSHGAGALVEPVLAEPASDVDPRRLIVVDGVVCLLDIRFRMLQTPELARATGFDDDYQFVGTITDVTKQIGNAIPVNLAAALVGAMLGGA